MNESDRHFQIKCIVTITIIYYYSTKNEMSHIIVGAKPLPGVMWPAILQILAKATRDQTSLKRVVKKYSGVFLPNLGEKICSLHVKEIEIGIE